MMNDKFFSLDKNFKIKLKLFIIGIFLIFLDSFSIFNIPFPWIGLMLCTATCLQKKIMSHTKLFWSLIILIILLILITFVTLENNKAPLNFIVLRILNIISFGIIVNYFALQDYHDENRLKMENYLIILGLFFSIISILGFILNAHNLQDLNIIDQLRNRPTTGKGDQYLNKFSFAFDSDIHKYDRAIGTFREPSFLMNALILPFFLSIKNRKYFISITIGICVYLTYSLAIFFALLFSLIFSFIIIYRNKLFIKKFILFYFLIIFLCIVFLIADFNFSNLYFQRLNNFNASNNRLYIYENLDIILGNFYFGNGIGYGFFSLGEHMALMGQIQSGPGQEIIPVSFLSLPLNMLSSGGIICLLIIVIWIFYHNLLILVNFLNFNLNLYLLIVPLNIFLLLYFSSLEELHIWHAIGLGLLLSYLGSYKKVN